MKLRPETVIGIPILCLVIFGGIRIIDMDKRIKAEWLQTRHNAYSAWCKFHQRNDITFEEWTAMRETKTLPTTSK